MPAAIEFDKVGKLYRLGLVSTKTLSHDLERWWKTSVLGKEDPFMIIGETNDRASKGNSDYVWALRDIDFKVEEGDVLGIIGKNGAGKSTLLKLLSKVTAPTTGTIRARGRIGSLLEVGTGFHPEMTGLENIYMNGAILGMTKAEIKSKLDEIVDFSGCERYLDTPVNRYSSGMMVRLGFAVAAHLDPEILVVDEVLAVGDAEFQKKAIGKMKDVSKGQGRTVLFVSHNMTAVKSLCKNGIILQNGTIIDQGPVDSMVRHYLRGGNEIDNHKKWNEPEIKKNGFELLEIGARKKDADWTDLIKMDDEIEIVTRFRLTQPYKQLHLVFHFKNEQGETAFSSLPRRSDYKYEHKEGQFTQICMIPANFLNSGNFSLDLYVVEDRLNGFIIENDIINFMVSEKGNDIGTYMGREPGDVTPDFEVIETEE